MKNMTISKRRFELELLRKRYRQATKSVRVTILGEFCANFGYNRKYAIRLLQMEPDINKSIGCKKRGPKPKYQPEKIVPILKEIWFASDQVCSKKLQALIPFWLPHYEALNGVVEPDIRNKPKKSS